MILVFPLPDLHGSMKTILLVWLCPKTLSDVNTRVIFVPLRTHLMVADALTKSLPVPAHAKHRDVMIGRVPFCVRSLRSSHCVSGG